MMESSNFYELQQQQLPTFSSLPAAAAAAAAQSTTGWNPNLPLNNDDEYDHYMNEILPMSAQLTTNNPINYFGHQRCPNYPTTNQIQLGWNISPSSSSTNTDYVLDSVITSSSTNLPTHFMPNYFTNNGPSSKQNLSFSSHHSTTSNKTSACKDKAISRTKRVSGSSQNDAAPKKQRAPSHSSSKLPKVVKEKIGDRIAALHRLVAPFGKTDAASVLTEALGYIHFLHHQIQTLSMSCLKPSQSNRLRCVQQVSGKQECWEGDLKSRGLSLVPISAAAYVSSSTTTTLRLD